MNFLTKHKDTTIEQAFITSIDKVKGRIGLFLKNGLHTTGNYLYDINDLRVGISVIVGKVDGFYTIVNMIETDSIKKSYAKTMTLSISNPNLIVIPPVIPEPEEPEVVPVTVETYTDMAYRFRHYHNYTTWADMLDDVSSALVYKGYDTFSALYYSRSAQPGGDWNYLTRSIIEFPIPILPAGRSFTSGTVQLTTEDWDSSGYDYSQIQVVGQLNNYSGPAYSNNKAAFSSFFGGVTAMAQEDAFEHITLTLTEEMLSYMTANTGGRVAIMLRLYNFDYLGEVPPYDFVGNPYEQYINIWGIDSEEPWNAPLLTLTY